VNQVGNQYIVRHNSANDGVPGSESAPPPRVAIKSAETVNISRNC